MSRIGKKPIAIPKGVTATLTADSFTAKGPNGTLTRKLPPDVIVKIEGDQVIVLRKAEARRFGAFHGLARALLANMVTGVSEGFKKELTIVGIGYKVALEGKKLVFNLGYSHQVEFPLPNGLAAEIGDKGTSFTVKGADRELLGQTCATIRGFRPPEPYKGKGIRYTNETVRQKAGKAGVK